MGQNIGSDASPNVLNGFRLMFNQQFVNSLQPALTFASGN
jgi:hypothetical protein